MVGCSVYSATTRPDYKDASIVAPGASRSALIDRLGQPCRTTEQDKQRKDIFEQSDAAQTSGQRALRATGYALFDLATAGLGEFFGSEVESQAKRECTTYTVTYDANDRAQSVETRSWVVEPPSSASAQRAGYCGIDYHSPACSADSNRSQ